MSVFVSVLPQKFFAERIAGPRANVFVMVGPGQSPATYEPTPKQMAQLAEARLYFSIGVPFEGVWLKKLADINPEMGIVDTAGVVAPRSLESHLHQGEGSLPGRELIDPHIWTSPLFAINIARAMTEAFIASDPDHRPEYEERHRLLVEDLRRLDADIRRLLSTVRNRRFLVFHPSWGYFADTYGLEQVAIEKGGIEPGAQSLAGVIEAAKGEKIEVVFVQEQFGRRSAEAIAAAIGGRVIAVDPLAEDYIDNLLAVAGLFAETLR